MNTVYCDECGLLNDFDEDENCAACKVIEKLKDKIKYKDLDIEMYVGALSGIKKVVDAKQQLESWQKL